ncbi:Oidioi.mRNA.OKI2018_I69.chr1.g2338.t1.cds [Oikopleura dioica]|uniref:Oidioi.mRNA.OKI2018_I69.chr1.g2338.t1.cds n=1 Tax=Oikopleura dioica TaxID=34765 RepID=A0ABN7SW62_OIKDI|nr:Oidioi.mRNA.OKI2018_I69.chr1.g2338.t1.cds [Oikopleura dioica]
MQEQEKTAKSAKASNFLVHHSRDTAEKQWAETKRLTLQGLTKLFKDNKSGLNPAEWVRCWKGMLQYIEEYAFSDNKEVSGGALEAFKELLEASPGMRLKY